MMIIYTIVKEINEKELAGTSMGILNLAPFLGVPFFNTLIGWRLDCNWNGKIMDGARVYELAGYNEGFWLYFGFSIIAFLVSFFIKEKSNPNKY